MGFFYTPASRDNNGSRDEEVHAGRIVSVIVLGLVIVLSAGMAGCPKYSVWSEGLKGQAELARAEQNRQIKIQEAQAIKDSAVMLAEAEVSRARGVAEANEIVAEGLGGPEGYLRYLWIQHLADQSSKVIYVPTEGQIPIMEAGRTPQPLTKP